MAKNSLTGSIPVSIGAVKALRDLDVSFTGLSGNIPISLRQLRNLEKISIQMTKLASDDVTLMGLKINCDVTRDAHNAIR